MRAAVLYEFGSPLRIEEVEVDPPCPGEVLVRLTASGVCHSDLHTAQGIHPAPLPAILGHEGAGVVVQVGDGVERVTTGDHVVLSWLPYCGRCRWCAAGRPNLCDDLAWSDAGTMRDGSTRFHRGSARIHHYTTSSFAELSVVPEQTVIPVDRSLPLAELALIGCAVMTGVGAVTNTAGVRPGQTVAVVGCGGVGLNVVQGAVIAGASAIVALDVVDSKLRLAEDLGATHAINTTGSGGPAEVRSQLERIVPGGVDHSFEALGRPSTIELAVELAGKGGSAVLVGMAPPNARIPIDALSITCQERTIKGCWYGSCRPPVDFPVLVELYRSGRLRLDPL
ncbi:MAG: alcohol dehydrogenase catalytic domain-containing protein, partial [Gaiellales bacterium]